jgi:ribonuclease HI
MKEVTIFTDGACSGNPGPGGFGAILIYGKHRREISEGFRLTTNNRMELLAVIRALESLKERCRVRVYSDSKYVVDSLNLGWAKKWKSRGWKRGSNERAENVDLWEKLLSLVEDHDCEFNWVKGHAGHEENERADQLSVNAIQSPNLAVDSAYEQNPKRSSAS